MTGAINFLLSFSVLLAAVQANILNANNVQSCTDLCASCEGTATFEYGICKCVVPENDTKGRECLMRLKCKTDYLGLDTSLDKPEDAERSTRCSLLGSRRRLGSADADIVASYFMNGGPITGSPLLGSSTNGPCVSSSGDPLTASVNPSNAKPPPAQPTVEKPMNPPIAKNPVVTQPSHTCPPSQFQPMVSSSWMPSHDAGYSPIIGSPQSYQPVYPQILSAIPHMVMALPNAMMRAASQIPSHTSGLLFASQHSPILASLASGTHGVLQRLDKMVAPYVSEENKIVGAPQQQASQCPFSSSKMLGAPAPTEGQAEPVQINASMLQQVLAQQNSLLEAFSQQLEGLSPQVGTPRMHYGSMPPGHYIVGAPQQSMAQYAPQPVAQYAPQPVGQYAAQCVPQPAVQYCGDAATTVGAKAPEFPKKPSVTLPQENDIVSATNPSPSTSKVERNVSETAPQPEKTPEENKKPEEQEIQNIQREPRMRSSNRRKRGDVKYAKKKNSVVPQLKSPSTIP